MAALRAEPLRPGAAGSRRATLVRLSLFALVAAGAFVALTASGSSPSPERIQAWVDGLGAAGPLLFVPLSVTLSCLFVPAPALAGAAGLLFGIALGLPLAILAAVGAASAQYLITRHLARDQAGRLLPARARRLDDFLERRGFLAVLYIRLAPVIPFVVSNYAAGLTRLRLRDLAAGTAVGALPRGFAYVALGGSLSDLGRPEAKVAVGLLVATAVAGALLGRRQVAAERRQRALEEPSRPPRSP